MFDCFNLKTSYTFFTLFYLQCITNLINYTKKEMIWSASSFNTQCQGRRGSGSLVNICYIKREFTLINYVTSSTHRETTKGQFFINQNFKTIVSISLNVNHACFWLRFLVTLIKEGWIKQKTHIYRGAREQLSERPCHVSRTPQ